MSVQNDIRYYALLRQGDTRENPSGLARRTATPEGRLDETLTKDLTWVRDTAIYEWERGEEMGTDLVEISNREAETLIEWFRQKWAEG